MLKHLLLLLLLPLSLFGSKIVVKTQQIKLDAYPNAFNPSIIRYKDSYLLSFRYMPDMFGKEFTSFIGVVLLNKDFKPISEPQLLDSRFGSSVDSQSEDARLFEHGGEIYLVYNDCIEGTFDYSKRRDMFIAKLSETNGVFYLNPPLKLYHESKYHSTRVQKNWSPFSWNGNLLVSYSLNPHEVLFPNLASGSCSQMASSKPCIGWNLGEIRPSVSPQLVDGEYLGFFHSGQHARTHASNGEEFLHLVTGAYTFKASFPFSMTKISPKPLVGDQFYTNSFNWKVVVYPGGYVVDDNTLYLAYGKNDIEMWIATLDKTALFNSLVPVEAFSPDIFEKAAKRVFSR